MTARDVPVTTVTASDVINVARRRHAADDYVGKQVDLFSELEWAATAVINVDAQ